jgi:thiamine-phosphate pyrophosphorylase
VKIPVSCGGNKISINDSFGFYAVLTDPVRGYEYCTRLLVDYGIAFVQLRMKDVPRQIVIDTAAMMRKLTCGTKTRLIINDDPGIAKQVCADGVHIGQSDLPYHEARKIVGDGKIIGISTHSVKQMRKACGFSPDYIGTGPVYATPTKKNPDPVIGLNGLKNMLAGATVPAVAVGGITLENLPLVLSAGGKNFCMVRPITTAHNPEAVLKKILKIHMEFKV